MKTLFHWFITSIDADENSFVNINLTHLLIICLFSLAAFKSFSSYLVLYRFTTKRLGVKFLSLHSLKLIWFPESRNFNKTVEIFQTLSLWLLVTNILFWKNTGLHICWSFPLYLPSSLNCLPYFPALFSCIVFWVILTYHLVYWLPLLIHTHYKI